jgi:hypothetical protein
LGGGKLIIAPKKAVCQEEIYEKSSPDFLPFRPPSRSDSFDIIAQCKRLVKDFDKIVNPPKGYEDKFAEFRKLVKTAADRNETLFFK